MGPPRVSTDPSSVPAPLCPNRKENTVTKSMLPLCALLFAGSLGFSENPQDLGERVEKLEKQLEAADAQSEEQAKQIASLQEAQALTSAWFKGLPPAIAALNEKMDQARRDGFEKAGPNPRSKKAVLDGIKSFAHSLAPAKIEAEKAAPRRR